MRILVAESDPAFASAVRLALRSEGLRVDLAADFSDLLTRVASVPYDAAIIDLEMEGARDGSLFQKLARQRISIPFLGLLKDPAPEARIAALKAGADDCLTRPFLMGELAARVHALVRRAGRRAGDCLEIEDLVLHCTRRRAFRANEPVSLTEREFIALEMLVRAHGQAVPSARFVEALWHEKSPPNLDFVHVLMNRLRKKIDGGQPRKLLKTMRGVGYMISGGDGDAGAKA